MSNILFRCDKLTKKFGAVTAIDSVSFELEDGEIRALIGPNGAGKTTLFNLLTGRLDPTAGDVYFREESITNLSPESIVEKGVARSFQITNIFNEFEVVENVQVSLVARDGQGWDVLHNMSGLKRYHDEAMEILERVGLDEKYNHPAKSLSHGEKRALELAIVLARDPEVLLLDEPTAGMSQVEIDELLELITSLANEFTILIVEHNMDVVMTVAETVMVLHNGQFLAEGTPETIQRDETVRDAYLGGEV
ncbi:ABC transporter ATP-binding protein [Halosolutus amylolyticus]|uniref:Probable branched-chain amino acid transport ATP-binding protein LivG n=1 Tax=Halosolutus amylolyticus TaxID=2932267 RepID=A0ABD5PJU6_9EURY|nr:ABC transporter ATP-binding protein [Halosolutus amylolyticus]